MKKIIIGLVLFAFVNHGQIFCPRGPSHHLKRVNAPRHWELNILEQSICIQKNELEKQQQSQLQQALHEHIRELQDKRLKRGLKKNHRRI